MRVDHMAAARANMRQRTADAGPDAPRRLVMTDQEKQERRDHQTARSRVLSGCIACCRLHWLEGPGDELQCALLKKVEMGELKMDKPEREAAEGCRIPALYTEVVTGKRVTVTRLEVLQLVPFDVPESDIAEAAVEAGQAAPTPRTPALAAPKAPPAKDDKPDK